MHIFDLRPIHGLVARNVGAALVASGAVGQNQRRNSHFSFAPELVSTGNVRLQHFVATLVDVTG